MSEARNNVNCVCAVSYTHLDVYKRQIYDRYVNNCQGTFVILL